MELLSSLTRCINYLKKLVVQIWANPIVTAFCNRYMCHNLLTSNKEIPDLTKGKYIIRNIFPKKYKFLNNNPMHKGLKKTTFKNEKKLCYGHYLLIIKNNHSTHKDEVGLNDNSFWYTSLHLQWSLITRKKSVRGTIITIDLTHLWVSNIPPSFFFSLLYKVKEAIEWFFLFSFFFLV